MKKKQEPLPEDVDDREGWKRFERAVDAAVKSGPKHQKGSSPSKIGQSDSALDKSQPRKRGTQSDPGK